MNNRLEVEFGQSFVRIPLKKSPHIIHGDALETDWATVLPPGQCSFVFGNPPFIGAKYQSDAQRAQMRRIAALGKMGGTLDYVTAWFIKAGEYVKGGPASIGFVSTNSITQGEQVAQLWPTLFDRCRLEIAFAHRTFAWGSDARGTAHVHVVIIGLANRAAAPKERLLFSYDDINGEPHESQHTALSPYLFDASALVDPHVVVRETPKPLNGLPKLIIGSKPIDGGHFIFSGTERDEFLAAEPGAAPFLRPYVGAQEFLHGGDRWILALHDAPPSTLSTLPRVKERIAKVRDVRLKSDSKSTKALATPTLYHVNTIHLPLPCGAGSQFGAAGLCSNRLAGAADYSQQSCPHHRERHQTALRPAHVHHAYELAAPYRRTVGDYRYAIGLVYNTFPLPEGDLAKLGPLAEAVLDARAAHSDSLATIFTTPTPCPPICAAPIRRSTTRWTISIASRISLLTVNGWNIF